MAKSTHPHEADKVSDDSSKSKSTKSKFHPKHLAAKVPGLKRLGKGKDGKKKEMTPQDRRRAILIGVGGVLAGLIIFITVFGILIYKYQSDSKVTYNVAKVIPYPVMKVNGSLVGYDEYLFEVASIKQYYQSQPGATKIDFTSKEGKAKLKQLQEQVMTQLKSDEVSRQLIAKNKVEVTKKQIDDQLKQITESAGGDQKVRQVLAQYYGWTYDDLRRKVTFQLEKQALQKKITSDPKAEAQAKAKAQSVLDKIKAGEDFAALAKQHSQDSTAANGGDLGFFGKGQMDPTFEAAAYKLQPGEVSGLVKTQYGYHVIKVTAKKDDQVQASHILVQVVDFNKFMKDATDRAKVSQYLKI